MNMVRSNLSESALSFAAPSPLLGDSEAMLEVFRLIERVGPTDASVLLTGERRIRQGTGRAVHTRRSARRGGLLLRSTARRNTRRVDRELIFSYEKGVSPCGCARHASTGAAVVYGLRGQFLAGSALTGQENAGVGRTTRS